MPAIGIFRDFGATFDSLFDGSRFFRLIFAMGLFKAAQPRALTWVLKGGYAMELRIEAARTTKDIDLTMRSVFSSDEKKVDKKNMAVLEKLQKVY
jgi:nucleotidyltransferase AbiEii toxin of type IV toxin-antitoxin system